MSKMQATQHFPVISSLLSPHEIANQVLPHFGLVNAACEYFSGGFNHTYQVTSAKGTIYFLRVYRKSWRTLPDIQYEIDVLNHLKKKKFPAIQPLPTLDGKYYYPVAAPEGTRYIALFTLAPGPEINYKTNPEQIAERYGKAVAEMHNALDDFVSHHKRFQLDLDYFTQQPLKFIEQFAVDRRNEWEYIKYFANKLHQRLLELPIGNLELGFCHGDLQGYHANVDSDNTLTFFDFDCGGFGFRAYDLAVFLWCCRLEDAVANRWDPFLNSYQTTRPICALDIRAIPLFTCARYLWHIGVHTQNAHDWGIGFLNDDYFTEHISRLKKAEEDYLS